MNTAASQPPYVVKNKSPSARMFDQSRPRLGTGGNMLGEVRERVADPSFVDAVWHLASHMNGVAVQMERDTGLVKYDSVNPPGQWGRATSMARDAMAHKLDPRRIRAERLS